MPTTEGKGGKQRRKDNVLESKRHAERMYRGWGRKLAGRIVRFAARGPDCQSQQSSKAHTFFKNIFGLLARERAEGGKRGEGLTQEGKRKTTATTTKGPEKERLKNA